MLEELKKGDIPKDLNENSAEFEKFKAQVEDIRSQNETNRLRVKEMDLQHKQLIERLAYRYPAASAFGIRIGRSTRIPLWLAVIVISGFVGLFIWAAIRQH